MGSFSYSCSLSGLPICSGDPVVLLPIKPMDNWWDNSEENIRKAGKPSFISNDGERVFFVEGTYPIFGTYDDYGGIEDIIEDENTKFIEEYYGLPIKEFCACICDNRKNSWETDEYSYCHGLDKKTKKYKEIIALSATWFRKDLYDKLCAIEKRKTGYREEIGLGFHELLIRLGFEFVKDENEENKSKQDNRYHLIYKKGNVTIKTDGHWIENNIYHLDDLKQFCKEKGEDIDIEKVRFGSLEEQIYELLLPTAREKFLVAQERIKKLELHKEENKKIEENIRCEFIKRGGTTETPWDQWFLSVSRGNANLLGTTWHDPKIDDSEMITLSLAELPIEEKQKIVNKIGKHKIYGEPSDALLELHHVLFNAGFDLDPINRYTETLFCAPDYGYTTKDFFLFCKEKILTNLEEKPLKSNIIDWLKFRQNLYYLGRYLYPIGTSPQCGEHKLIKRIFEKALEVINDDMKTRDYDEEESTDD